MAMAVRGRHILPSCEEAGRQPGTCVPLTGRTSQHALSQPRAAREEDKPRASGNIFKHE
jgi:hypothetical protein